MQHATVHFEDPSSWPRVCLDNLNSGSEDLVCGLYHGDRAGSGLDVSFSYV